MERKPLTYPYLRPIRLHNLKEALEQAQRRPYIGVTQGGSSRENPGAVPAATATRASDAQTQRVKKEKDSG